MVFQARGSGICPVWGPASISRVSGSSMAIPVGVRQLEPLSDAGCWGAGCRTHRLKPPGEGGRARDVPTLGTFRARCRFAA